MTVGMMRLSISLCLLAAGLNAAGVRLLRQDVQLTQPLAVGATIAVGDFNGDGRPDLAAGMAGGIAVMLNRGRAAFGPAIYTGIPQPAPVAIADFNLDGKVDVAAYGQIALGRGDGTFLSPQATSPAWFAAEAGDFNGDGLPDLAAVQTGACGNGDAGCSALVILLGNGDATFRSADRFQIAGGYKPVVVDFNRDGKADLAVNLGNAVAIFLGNGDGSFRSLKAASLPAGAYTTRLLAADLNGDGIPDLVSRSHVLLGLGDGTFRSPAPYNLAVPGQTSPFESSFAL
ncbi:MAG TPA: VCBS repeat-containing protein, partial [Bryobacteraceae bacterium]